MLFFFFGGGGGGRCCMHIGIFILSKPSLFPGSSNCDKWSKISGGMACKR